jgi:hypothetical protein
MTKRRNRLGGPPMPYFTVRQNSSTCVLLSGANHQGPRCSATQSAKPPGPWWSALRCREPKSLVLKVAGRASRRRSRRSRNCDGHSS